MWGVEQGWVVRHHAIVRTCVRVQARLLKWEAWVCSERSLAVEGVRQSESDRVSYCLVMCVRQCCC